MMRKAFSLPEMLLVVVVVGILSTVAIAHFRDDNMALAANQVLSHIRYTQHLAMSEHKFDPKDDYYLNHQDGADGTRTGFWFASRWQIWFFRSGGDVCYAVYSDKDREGNCDTQINNGVSGHMEAALDPSTSNPMIFRANGDNPDFDLTTKYGITNITTANCNQGNGNPTLAQIVFDEKGVPYGGISALSTNNAYSFKLTTNPCTITLTGSGGGTATITITPETGYAQITNVVENN